MRHPGFPWVDNLTNRIAPWSPIVGLVALVVGIVLVIGTALPDPGIFTARVFASARHLADVVPSERDSRQQASHQGSGIEMSAGIADPSENDDGIRTELLGTGARGAFHAGDRSPIAVSNRRDLRLDLMEMMAWRSRQASSFLGSCLFC